MTGIALRKAVIVTMGEITDAEDRARQILPSPRPGTVVVLLPMDEDDVVQEEDEIATKHRERFGW